MLATIQPSLRSSRFIMHANDPDRDEERLISNHGSSPHLSNALFICLSGLDTLLQLLIIPA